MEKKGLKKWIKSLDFSDIRCYTTLQLHKEIGRRVNESSLFFVDKEEL